MIKNKILFFLPTLNGGGAERVTINIIRQLNHNICEINLVVLECNGPLLELIPDYVNIIELNIKKTIFSILKLKKVIKEIDPDVVYSSLFRSHIALIFALIFKKKKPKIILRSPNSPKLLVERGELSLLMKLLLDYAYKNADLIIAQTPEMKNEISKFHNVGEKKIKVVFNPIDKELINYKIKNVENPFNPNFINVVAAGRITEQKGFDILIKSFEKVIEKNDLFRLYIIGEGSNNEKEKLIELINKLKISNYIHFLGFSNNPYKYFYYSDLYVLSSRWEGLPNTVLENLYLEKPIIATKCIPFMSSLLKDGENSILVDVENIEQLYKAILEFKRINPIKYLEYDNDFRNYFRKSFI